MTGLGGAGRSGWGVGDRSERAMRGRGLDRAGAGSGRCVAGPDRRRWGRVGAFGTSSLKQDETGGRATLRGT